MAGRVGVPPPDLDVSERIFESGERGNKSPKKLRTATAMTAATMISARQSVPIGRNAAKPIAPSAAVEAKLPAG